MAAAVVTPGHHACLYISGAGTAYAAEALTNVTANTAYQVTAAAHRVMHPTVAVTTSSAHTYVPFTPPGASKFTVNRLAGTVTYGTDQGAGALTMTGGQWLEMQPMLYAKDFSIGVKPKLVDTTVMSCAAGPYVSNGQVLRELTGSIGTFFTPDSAATFAVATVPDPPYFLDHLTDDTVFALRFYMTAHWEMLAWVKVDTEKIALSIDNMEEETVSFQGCADLEGRVCTLISTA